MLKNICNPNCIYFPYEPDTILEQYIDENGLKRRNAVFICNYDDHRILSYSKCEHYKCIKQKQ